MTAARHFAIAAFLSAIGLCLVSACGSGRALDVTAPDDSKTDFDYEISDDQGGPSKSGKKGGSEGHDPCEEKKCGTGCMQCSPTDQSCDEIQVLKECNLEGNCVIGPVDCTVPEEEEEEE